MKIIQWCVLQDCDLFRIFLVLPFSFYILPKNTTESIKMADKNLPWGLINDKISPGSAKVGFNAIV